MMQAPISISKLRKAYKLYERPSDRLKEILLRRKYHHEFVALDGITMQVRVGETLGIVGENGAGKSTLLKIIAGTLKPTEGEVKIQGKVSSLLELGSGFHPEFTGIDNIYFYGSLLGISSQEMRQKIDEIIAFAEIGEHINYPLKTYSSGMYVRLAFSVAMAVEPDILVVDEALSVGDLYFQKKSTDRILSFKENDKTILFCSHSMYYINRLCDRVIWLKNGRMVMEGSPHEVTQAYETYQLEKEVEKGVEKPGEGRERAPQCACLVIRKVLVTPYPMVRCGDDLEVEIEVEALDDSVPYRVSAGILRIDEIVLIGTYMKDPALLYGSRKVKLTFPALQLREGSFFLKVYVMDENLIHIYDVKATSPFTVPKESFEPGFITVPHRWTVLQ